MLPLDSMLVGFMGAFSTEALKLYQLYYELPESEFRSLTKSKIYPLIVLVMIAASGFVAAAFSERVGGDSFMAFIHGAFAGPTMRTILKSLTPDKQVKLGMEGSVGLKGLL